MRVSVLGPIHVDEGSVALSPRDRLVLTALTVRVGQVVPAEQLAEALWGDEPPTSWSKVVPGCVMRLRRALGAPAIRTTPTGYRLERDAVEIDAEQFRAQVERGHELLLLREPDRAAHTLAAALTLWRGRPYSDVEDWAPARITAAHLEELRLRAEEWLLEARMQSGGDWEVVTEAQTRVTEAPLRERRWALLAQAQYRDGRQADALTTLRRARRMLSDELGLDPGPELVSIEQAILRQDPSLLDGTPRETASPVCPFFGLVAADVGDAELYFGRERDLTACLRALSDNGVLVVAGPSGVGKSSLARAGLAARLRGEGRQVTVMTPGAHPLQALASVPAPTGRSVLVVDQCEEALVQAEAPGERERFFAELCARADHEALILTLRADRLGEIAAFSEFARLVERGLYLLGPMAESELREAIELPARQAGLLLEPGLVDLLLRDAAGEPGALPLVSHALRQTWLRREGRTLTVAGYSEAGGIQGAIAQSAERVYQDLPDDQRHRLRELMLRLVEPNVDADPVRLRVARHLVVVDGAADQLVERLVDARLLTSDQGAVEMAHEALARNWPRLRLWLDEDVEGQRILHHLTVSASTWDAMDRAPTELYRGARLAAALDWRDASGASLTALEREFLDASAAQEQAELAATRAQLEQERRTVRRLRWLGACVTALTLVAGMAWYTAAQQRGLADDRATVAEARRLAARALVERPYDRALLMAVEAVNLWDSAETRGNLLNTVQRSPRAAAVIRNEGTLLRDFESSPDGRLAVALDRQRALALFDLRSRTRTAHLATGGIEYAAPTYSPDGKHIAVAALPAECWWVPDACPTKVQLLNAGDLTDTSTQFLGFPSPVADLAFDRSGELLAAIAPMPWWGEEPAAIAIWRVDRPSQPILILGMPEPGVEPHLGAAEPDPSWVRFSPDGRHLFASGQGPTVVFDAQSGRVVRTLRGRGGLALSPDGSLLAVFGADNAVDVVEVDSGERRLTLLGHTGLVIAATFSTDGEQIATASADQTGAVWSLDDGTRTALLNAHAGTVLGAAFASGGLHTAGADGAIIRWNLSSEGGLVGTFRQVGPLPVSDPGILPVGQSTGSVLLYDGGGWVVLNGRTGVLTPLQGASTAGDTMWAAIHPSESRLAMVDDLGRVTLWDTTTGTRLVQSRQGIADNPGAIAFTPDGQHIVVVDNVGFVREFADVTLELQSQFRVELNGRAQGIRATHDGVIAITTAPADSSSSSSTGVVFADVDTQRTLFSQELPGSGLRANFSPDGSRYGFVSDEGTVGVVEVATGATVSTPDRIHEAPGSWVTFSPDSTTLYSIGFDGQLVMSDAADATPFARLDTGKPGLPATVFFHSDGRRLLLAFQDGEVLAFDTDPEAWAAHACAVAGRNLTEREWRDAVGDRPYQATCPDAPAVPGGA